MSLIFMLNRHHTKNLEYSYFIVYIDNCGSNIDAVTHITRYYMYDVSCFKSFKLG